MTERTVIMPSIGSMVHYVSYGTPKGEYASKCVAAIVTQVNDEVGLSVGLKIENPLGTFSNVEVNYDINKGPGSWHWPEYESRLHAAHYIQTNEAAEVAAEKL